MQFLLIENKSSDEKGADIFLMLQGTLAPSTGGIRSTYFSDFRMVSLLTATFLRERRDLINS